MSVMNVTQEIKVISILVGGLILGTAIFFIKKKACSGLLRFGGLLIALGLGGSVISGSKITETLVFIDTAGIGRAYVVGCMITMSGIVCYMWHGLTLHFKRNSK